MAKFAMAFVTFFFIFYNEAFGAMQIVIDEESDLKFGWKVKGDYTYISSGKQLQNFKNEFPEEFPFSSIASARGIWIVFPEWNPQDEWTKSVTFSYSTSAQLLESVSIRHNSGGINPIINIIANGVNHTQTPKIITPDWTDVTIPLKGTAGFKIQAIVNDKQDFILIDRIEATFVETSTSPRPRPAPTSRKPKPVNNAPNMTCQSKLLVALMIPFLSMAFMF